MPRVFRPALLAVLLLASCRPQPPASTGASDRAPEPGAVAGVHGGEPGTPEEQLVAAYILKEAHPPNRSGKVEWLRWGPHDLKGESHLGDPAVKLVRVRYRATPPSGLPFIEDRLYELHPEIVHAAPGQPERDGGKTGRLFATRGPANDDGDGWLAKAKEGKREAVRRNRTVTDEKPAPP